MRTIGLVLALLLFGVCPAVAKYMKADLEVIPIARIVKNLTAAAKKDPKDASIRFNLARAHAMAYAAKTEKAEALKGEPTAGVWFGYGPGMLPFELVATENKKTLKLAKRHLDNAIVEYRETLKLDPSMLAAELGLAWCLDQKGDKPEAIKAYRTVIEKAWPTEKKETSAGPSESFVNVEGVTYLIALLDPVKDKKEIDELKKRSETLEKLPRAITPIAIPLRPNLSATDIEARTAHVTFDVDGTGQKAWSWITRDAGWLVWDPKSTAKIPSGLRLFGGVTHWMFWQNGYDALRALDDNQNGELSGAELAGLAIWRDVDSDGVSTAEEVKPLSFYDIVSVSCAHQRDSQHPDQIEYSPAGVRFRDGSTRPSFDVILKAR